MYCSISKKVYLPSPSSPTNSSINFAQDVPVAIEQLTNTEQLNPILEKNIKESGDAFEGRNSSAKCLMTR